GIHVCSAMHYLHRRAGFLHLDLKPSNIVCEQGHAKVIDFSIARRPGRGHKGAGTRQYLAPEQARGDLVTAATDVWGIGVVLFEVATGRKAVAIATIVVIDDERLVCDALQNLLRDHGHEVFTAYNGREGVASLRQRRPRFTLLDLNLPDINGIEVLKEIREREPQCAVR